jgi:hypothetical protein
MEAGYADYGQIRRDADLETLRKDERFEVGLILALVLLSSVLWLHGYRRKRMDYYI